jgi:hypothetical protein
MDMKTSKMDINIFLFFVGSLHVYNCFDRRIFYFMSHPYSRQMRDFLGEKSGDFTFLPMSFYFISDCTLLVDRSS